MRRFAGTVRRTVPAMGVLYWLDIQSGGWFRIYAVDLPAYHTPQNRALLGFLASDFLGSFSVISLSTALAAASVVIGGVKPWRSTSPRQHARFVLLMAACASGSFAVASMWQPLVMRNVLVLYAIVGAAFLPVVLEWAHEQLHERRDSEEDSPSIPRFPGLPLPDLPNEFFQRGELLAEGVADGDCGLPHL